MSLISFPCDFTIKALGKKESSIEQDLRAIVKKYFPEQTVTFNARPSRNQNFIGITFTLHVHDQKSIDQIYLEIQRYPSVMMAL